MKFLTTLLIGAVALVSCQSAPTAKIGAGPVDGGSVNQFAGLWVGTVGNADTSHKVTFQINVKSNNVSGYYQQNNEGHDSITSAQLVGGALKKVTGPINWTLHKNGVNGLSGSWRNTILTGPVNATRVVNGSSSGSSSTPNYTVSGECRAADVEAEANRLQLRSQGMGICQMSRAYEEILKKAAAAYRVCSQANNAREMELAARDASETAKRSCVSGVVQ